MTELERLTQLMDEHTARAVRLGYALGWQHGREEDRNCDLDTYTAPEFRALGELGI